MTEEIKVLNGNLKMQIIYKNINHLKAAEYNPRKISDVQIEHLKKSLINFDCVEPIVINTFAGREGIIVGGHQRLKVMKEMGVVDVPCIEVSLPIEKEKELNIRLNKNTGDFDLAILEENFVLDELLEWGFDEKELNFDAEIIEGLCDEDEVPDFTADIITVPGDIWLLGDHRLMCGDSTIIDSVSKLMNGRKADMVFTDPPYNTGMTAKSNSGSTRLSHMFEDSFTDEEWQNFMRDFCASYEIITKKDAFIFVCLDWRRSHELIPHLKKHWKFSNLIIWDKMVHGLGSDYKYTHEFIHVCKKGKPPLANNKEGEKEYQDVWRIQRKMGKDEEHPIELCERAIRHSSIYKNIVADFFGGSGSTLIACEKNNRSCYMMELDTKYCDVIINRWQKFTGKKAVHAETGQEYAGLS